MSEATSPRRVLHLIVEGLSSERLAELNQAPPDAGAVTEVFQLTETNAREALGKIFASDTVTVWGAL